MSTNGATPIVSTVKDTFQAMLAPTTKSVSRKAWGIDVSTVWLPYFTAAKVTGAIHDIELSDADLGAPFRLRRDKDTGEVKFSNTGRPMFANAPNLDSMVVRVRENLVAGLHSQTRAVMDENPDAYKAQVERQQRAGDPIIAKQNADLELAVMAQLEAALLEAAPAQAAPVEPAPAVAPEPVLEAASATTPESEPVATGKRHK
mgnify:CR=1 FL=1